jgi:hypothetical protein
VFEYLRQCPFNSRQFNSVRVDPRNNTTRPRALCWFYRSDRIAESSIQGMATLTSFLGQAGITVVSAATEATSGQNCSSCILYCYFIEYAIIQHMRSQ